MRFRQKYGSMVAFCSIIRLIFAFTLALQFQKPFPVVHALSIGLIPKLSPATGLSNQVYSWRSDQKIRYQVAGPEDGKPIVLVHGLFVNADHWRHTILRLGREGYRAYALDLWGCGYASKPPRDSDVAQSVNGEIRRGLTATDSDSNANRKPATLPNAVLGSPCGTKTRIVDVELTHPLQSPYNFYTWADQVIDFSHDVVLKDRQSTPITLVCNSIGTITALQAGLDEPEIYNGVFIISPNFRELHSAEVPFPKVSMPLIRWIQKLLRNRGQGLFDILATPATVKQILKEPYAVTNAVDDTLVDVLLSPLLTEGASDVVFDTLSYSAGPLPELQLSELTDTPVWVCYGTADPWTPAGRVEALKNKPTVEKVVALEGIGHCPHDEAPELVESLLLEFLHRIEADSAKKR
jgi:pimeloyl-ACP methyl ester carboxylesterase